MSDASVVTEVEAAEPDDRNTIEILAAILLGLAGLLTAYAAYYGALAGGDALKGYTQSQRTLQDANSYYNDTLGYFNQDQSVFLQYQIKIEENADDVAQVIRETLFSDRLETAYAVWNELPVADETPSPLDLPEYVIEEEGLADDLYSQAQQEFDDAQQTDDQGDNMDLASVFLAVSLFFAGIAGLFKIRRMSIILLVFSSILIVPGFWAIGKGKAWW